jgi:hypothetical protein
MTDDVDSTHAFREDDSGWIFVHLEGTPYERGRRHGRLLAAEIGRALKTAKFLPKFQAARDSGQAESALRCWSVAWRCARLEAPRRSSGNAGAAFHASSLRTERAA